MKLYKFNGLMCRPGTNDYKTVADVFAGKYNHGGLPFAVEKDERWLDGGAHIGAFSAHCLRRGATPTAVEPSIDNFEILRANMPGRVKIIHGSLGVNDGNCVLYKTPFKECTEFTTAKTDGNMPTERVRVYSINNLIESSLIDCVKLSICGKESDILDSAYLGELKKLVIEYDFTKSRSISDFQDRIRFLKAIFDVIYISENVIYALENPEGHWKLLMKSNIYCLNY